MLRPSDIHYHHSLLAGGDVGIGARGGDVAGVGDRNQRAGHYSWRREIGGVENFQAIFVGDEAVAELHGNPGWPAQLRRADPGGDLGRRRIVQVNHHQSGVAQNIGVHAGDDDAMRAVELAVRIERQRALQEIVARLAIEQRAYSRRMRFGRSIADHD